MSYLSIAVDGFPNLFMIAGPNSGPAAGSLIPLIEQQVMYAVQATAKLQRDRLKSIEVKPEAVQDFDQYLEVRPERAEEMLLLPHEHHTRQQAYFPKVSDILLSDISTLHLCPSTDRVHRTLPLLVQDGQNRGQSRWIMARSVALAERRLSLNSGCPS